MNITFIYPIAKLLLDFSIIASHYTNCSCCDAIDWHFMLVCLTLLNSTDLECLWTWHSKDFSSCNSFANHISHRHAWRQHHRNGSYVARASWAERNTQEATDRKRILDCPCFRLSSSSCHHCHLVTSNNRDCHLRNYQEATSYWATIKPCVMASNVKIELAWT